MMGTKPDLILRAECALIEISKFRAASAGEYRERSESAWREINDCRQSLINSLSMKEEIAYEVALQNRGRN